MEGNLKNDVVRPTCAGRLVALALAVSTFLMGGAANAQNTPANRDALVKAAMVYNFIRFIEWPDETVNQRVVCTFQESELTAGMKSIEGKPVGSANVAVREISSVEDLDSCDVLVVSRIDGYLPENVKETMVKSSILTVSDEPNFASRGGIIGFVELEGRVGFEVNVERATASGLNFSSRLLRLAKIVSTDSE